MLTNSILETGLMVGAGVITLLGALRMGKWLLSSEENSHAERVREAQRGGDHRRAGDLQAKRGNYEMAARLYERGGEFARQGHALRKVGDLRGAAEAFSKAKEHAPAADLYCRTDQYEKAAEQYLKAGDRPSLRRAAQAFQKIGQFARAGRLMQKLGEFESAARLYTRAETLDPPDLVVSMLESAALALPGASPKRAELLHQAASAAYKLGLYERTASAFDGAKKPLEAAKLYERALSRFDLAAALYARAAAQLSHPGIVTIYDIGRRGDREFIRWSWSTATLLRRCSTNEGSSRCSPGSRSCSPCSRPSPTRMGSVSCTEI